METKQIMNCRRMHFKTCCTNMKDVMLKSVFAQMVAITLKQVESGCIIVAITVAVSAHMRHAVMMAVQRDRLVAVFV